MSACIVKNMKEHEYYLERAQQLENGSQPYISNIERFTNSYSIAVEELNTKKLPFIILDQYPIQILLNIGN